MMKPAAPLLSAAKTRSPDAGAAARTASDRRRTPASGVAEADGQRLRRTDDDRLVGLRRVRVVTGVLGLVRRHQPSMPAWAASRSAGASTDSPPTRGGGNGVSPGYGCGGLFVTVSRFGIGGLADQSVLPDEDGAPPAIAVRQPTGRT